MAPTQPGIELETVVLRGGLSVALPALQVLWSLEDRQFEVGLTDDGVLLVSPKSRLTEGDDRAIRQHRDELVALVRWCDEDVAARRDVFVQQLAAAPAGTVPRFQFRPDVPYEAGRCHSCGEELPRFTFGRCWRCALAWRLTCRLPVSAERARAVDEARHA